MLVLSRRIAQKIVFPSINTTIQVVSTKSGIVRLGIEAPDRLPVFREEVVAQLINHEQPSAMHETAPSCWHSINNRLNASIIGLTPCCANNWNWAERSRCRHAGHTGQ
jgi:carbon storage regulator CsrA